MNKEERLIEYINKDYSYINYKTGVEDGTDFDKFCIQHCKDIEELLEENKKYEEVFEKLKKAIDECWYMDSKNVADQVFLKKCELKDILKEVE